MSKLYYYFNISEINMEGKPISEDDISSYIFSPVDKGIVRLDLNNKVVDIVTYPATKTPFYSIKPHFNLTIEGEPIKQNFISNKPFNGYYIRNLIKFIKDHPKEFKKMEETDVNKYLLAEKLIK